MNERIKSKIRTIPNWPKKGIMFRDITTLLQDADGLRDVIKAFVDRYKDAEIDKVVGIEARGFILGGAIADKLHKGFVMVRKPGKLPAETESEEYELEYGTDKVEIHKDAISKGENILIVDDLLATGGTATATAHLVQRLGGNVLEIAFIVDLPDIGGKKKLEKAGFKVFNLVEFEGE